MPAPLEWKELKQSGEVPGGRSGHSLTYIGSQRYLLLGGLEDAKNGKVAPNGDVYVMRMGGVNSEGKWYKATVGGDEKPLARTQHIALYTSDRVFVFGGHQGPNSRLNDTWFLDVKGPEFEWNKAGDEKVSTSNQESKGGAPHPRANSGACLYQNKVYLFGGHGGLNYARIAYNDLYAFDLETETWSKVVPKNASPDGRGGHSVFASDNRIYVYGGWNSEQQYNNVVMFDLEKEEWSDPDIYNEIPRWNHSSLLVEAIPTWKFFIFGGECAEYNEGVARAFGEYANSSCYLDIGTMKWATFASDSEKHPSLPSPREYSAMAYDTQDSKEAKLVVFGGWNNGWFNDLFTLNVSKIVGPSYAIISSDPCLGQLSGKTPLRITGQGFRDQTIKVIFTQGNKPVDSLTKLSREATGTFVTETEIMVETPSFLDMGAKEHECVMQVSIGSGDFSTTWVTFTYFLNTRGDKSLAYGPGLLPEVCPGYPVEFVIQARNENCENRASGRDNFELKIRKIKKEVEVVEEVPEEGAEVDGEAEAAPKKVKIDPSASLLECKVVDNENGTYSCSYVCDEECEVSVEVLFMNDKGDMEQVRGSPYRAVFMNGVKPGDNKMNGGVMDRHIKKELERIQNDMTEQKKNCSKNDKDMKDVKTLLGVKEATESVIKGKGKVQLEIDQLDESLKLFMTNKQAKESQVKAYHKIQKEWVDLSKQAKETRKDIEKDVQAESDRNKVNIKRLEEEITQFTQEMKKREFFQYKCGTEMALTKLDGVFGELKVFENNIQDYGGNCAKFGNPNQIEKAVKDIELIKQTVDNMKVLWDHIAICMGRFDYFFKQKWIGIQPYEMEDEVKKLQKTLKDCKADKRCAAYTGILDEIKKWLVFLPLIAELADKDMRDRHWDALKKKINAQFTIDDNLVLKDIYDLNLGKYQEDVEEFTDQARQEAKMEKTLAKLDENWKDIVFEFSPHKDSGVQMIRLSEENFDMLEENQVSVTSMFSSRYLSTFEQKITYWQHSLAQISEIVVVISEVQRSWSFLENLFIHSDEVKKELPKESLKFIEIDKQVRDILADGFKVKKALDFCNQEYVLPTLEKEQEELTVCEKALNEFMHSKQMAFPRFFFVSPADLLDILSNGNSPSKVMVHMPKIISAIDTLELKETQIRPYAIGMHAGVGKEYVKFTEEKALMGKVENYLQDCIDLMVSSLREIARDSLKRFGETKKEDWLLQDPAQVTLLINICSWVMNVEKAFNEIGTNPGSLKTAYKNQNEALKGLIMIVQSDLEKPVRQKMMCLITMDAHSRDIINQLDMFGVMKSDEFQWQTQLKGIYDASKENFFFKIADACIAYGYEYLGNGARLVITPLTDRIYVTATQALHLKMGCAPAGPAGTGKTESTKDLAAALGKACYVFNCSDQMDYMGMAGIFKGLAASGSWGCFDEFNRLVPEVLSVCSVQFKSVTDAVKINASRFVIQGCEISLDPTCGAFITMNPGYLGRSELPEGLKALFRPITVVVPDLQMICENFLMAEGFIEAQTLSVKFTTLYFLCRDLLSKAAHYDWGLRAIKSVLVVAGEFKRDEPNLPEQAILMRALRDFNLPKIVFEDLAIFHGLLSDLFPGINVERKREMRFEKIIEDCAKENKLTPDANFVMKTVQLGELLVIRHCVFVMGPPGAGKSQTWKTLAKANDKDGKKTTWVDLNPKVTSTNELYGVVLLATREWKDGLMSKTMRDLGNIPNTNPKWIILDGDLDANWIESMNSVMDDNRLLTLASNERIPLKPHMRLIFEIRDLRFATPATVSRAGILFISDSDGSQWRAYYQSWIEQQLKFDAETKDQLRDFFEKYLPPTFFHCKKTFRHVVPQMEISMVISICKLLEAILSKSEVKGLEYVFGFACIWCIGGGYIDTETEATRKKFSAWWKDKWKIMKFPSKGTVFDYFVDIESNKLEEWSKMSTSDIISTIDTSQAISQYTIPTPDTIAATYLMKEFVSVNHSPILVGLAGCGKTQIIKGLLNELTSTGEEYLQQIVNFNFYTDANLLQMNLEQNLEKKAGKTYAPIGKYKLIWFVDDMNMPARDPYDTQTAIALLRQHRDYEHWYDKNKLTVKDIKNTQLIAAMNPTAGSFHVNPRLQRHFWLLAVGFPENTSLNTIYNAYLNKHFSRFKGPILEQVQTIIKATLSLHQDVERSFRKTAANFHYEFNVRHLTNVFQGLLGARQEAIKEPDQLVMLWIHETERIYGDRLVNYGNLNIFKALVQDIVQKQFSKFNLKKYLGTTGEPIIYASYVASLDDKLYDRFPNVDALSTRLQEGLREYNDTNAVMDLVLFEDAMKHVCKITRIIQAQQGHALLIGVGGSGKQSLSRLASFICQFTTTGIVISSTYNMNDLKTDLQSMYMKSGVQDAGLMFLFTEGQITNEKFLVYINDLLSSGEIADLFAAEDIDGIVNNIRPAVKSEGILDSKDNCWKFFIDRVKKNLHMALCFSPGESLRNRARKFPALVNCSVIDWFHPWPEDALLSVASKFLADVEMQSEEVRRGIENFMPYSFQVVNDYSDKILDQERRFVYTTPKSFLELIKLFKVIQAKKEGELVESKEQYELGVVRLTETAEIVAKLEEDLKLKSVEVEAKKKEADEQATIVGAEKVKVEAENAIAEEEAGKCKYIKDTVEAKMSSVQKDLDLAIPLVEKAQLALAGLKITDFRDLKALKKPPAAVSDVFTCVLFLLCGIFDVIPIDKAGKLKTEDPWKVALATMKDPQAILDQLNGLKAHIDDESIHPVNFKQLRPYIENPEFTPEIIFGKSQCCAGLCDFVINITQYYDVVVSVEPKKQAVREAQEQLATANEKKKVVDERVAELNAMLAELISVYNKAMAEKEAAVNEAARCERKLDLAQRLVGALGTEADRWAQAIIDLGDLLQVIIGDVLLASAFVSYVGPFNKKFRDQISAEFITFFKANNIPMSAKSNPLSVLTDEATVAGWNNCSLPPDQVSTENGAILTNSERFSLIIDPQLQGIQWIRKTYDSKGLKVTRLSNPKMVKTIEFSVESGDPVLIENLENSIDAVIQPVYSRAVVKRGKSKYIKMGDKELQLHPSFNLFLHTKLSNPHYPPEIQAECTLINFTVTESGLEDQLLALVVKMERPDLAAQSEELIQQQNSFKIQLKELEKGLLKQLAEAEGDILENIELIENLEYSKKLSVEISEKVEIAKSTQADIQIASEFYRPAANRGALVFFLLNELYKIHSFYKFSLDSFIIVVKRAIDLVAEAMNPKKKAIAQEPKEGDGEGAEEGAEKEEGAAEAQVDEENAVDEVEKELSPEELSKRVAALTESITFQAFNYTRRGTLEADKMIIASMLCFRIMIRKGLIDQAEVDHLVRGDIDRDAPSLPENLKFIPEVMWPAVKGLEKVKCFDGLQSKMESESPQFKKWYADQEPEVCDMPKSIKDISLFHRIILLRALRPDRLINALKQFVRENMGEIYVEQPSFDIIHTYSEMNTRTPIFFVLFPGVDPTPEVEKAGYAQNKTIKDQTFINISMGQGQEDFSIKTLKEAGKNGNWVMFQNVHLMQSWMKRFEREFEIVLEEEVHPDFRCFISSEPPPLPEMEIIPESILQNSLKVANEAPTDLKSNIRRAYSKFEEDHFEKAKTHKEKEYKALLFGLIMFHSLILGRRKFGSQGWSRKYNFNDGDLRICGDILHNYLSKYDKVPYADLRYLYGEIMYGGHITDDWDRRTNSAYLLKLIVPNIMMGMNMTLAPGFRSPDPAKFGRDQYIDFVETKLPIEVPQMFGLHPNAEIGYLTTLGEKLFITILSCSGDSGGGGGVKKEDVVKVMLLDYLGQIPEEFVMLDLQVKFLKDPNPYAVVCMQECERMNGLLFAIRKSLLDLNGGLEGSLNMTDDMELLSNKIFVNAQPPSWAVYPSNKPLNQWFADLLARVNQLVDYSQELIAPKSLWISGLFNPMSYITAIMQVTARSENLPLDGMILKTDILNVKDWNDLESRAEKGAFIHGFFLEGAGWEMGRGTEQGYLTDMILKDLHPLLPVMHVTSIEKTKHTKVGMYRSPAYMTTMRGPTYVFECFIRMESEETDDLLWVLAGVALLMAPE